MQMANPSSTATEEPEPGKLVYEVMFPDQKQLTAAGKGSKVRKNADFCNDMNQSNKKKILRGILKQLILENLVSIQFV